MAVDRGGLEYRIQAEDAFSQTTQKFREEIAKSRQEWDAFVGTLSKITGKASAAAKASRDVASAQERSARAARASTAANKESGQALTLREKAERAIANAMARRALNEERMVVARERGIQQELAATKFLSTREAAERSLARIQDKRAVAEEARTLAAQRGISLEGTSLQQKKELTVAEKELEAASRRLAVAQERASNKRLADLNAEAESLRRITAIEHERRAAALTAQRALERGIDLTKERASTAERLAFLDLKRERTLKSLASLEQLRSKTLTRSEKRATAALQKQLQGQLQLIDVQKQAVLAGKKIPQVLDPAALDAAGKAAGELQTRFALLNRFLGLAPVQRGIERLKTLRGELAQTEGRANRISFTFRRLFGILAAFTIVRRVVQGFRDMIRSAISFQAKIEQVTLGIASLFTAVGEVQDPFGRTVKGAEALALAQKEARRQTKLLQVDALRTAATFEQLAEVFQIGLAPGLRAGLDVDQVRRFAVQISQAAAAIGVPMNQLAEEIRSILAGTIQLRTTRIAAALGITNAQIRRWKELGILAEMLEDRFSAFTEAGKEAMKTFPVLATNVKAAFQIILGQAASGFFQELKGLLGDVLEASQEVQEAQLQPSQAAVRFFREIFEGLRASVAQARQLRSSLGLEDLLPIARFLREAFTVIAETLGIVIEGSVLGLKDASALVLNIVKAVGEITGLDEVFKKGDFKDVLRTIVRIATAVGAIKLGFSLVSGTILGILKLIVPWKAIFLGVGVAAKALLTTFKALLITINAIPGPIRIFIAALLAVSLITKKLLEDMFGVELKWKSVFLLVKNALVVAFEIAVNRIGAVWTRFISFFKRAWLKAWTFVSDIGIAIAQGTLRLLGAVIPALREEAENLRQLRRDRAEQTERNLRLEQKSRDNILKILEAEERRIWLIGAQEQARILQADKEAKTLGEIIKENLQEALGDLGPLLGFEPGEVDLPLDPVLADAKDLVELLERLPPIIRGARQELTRTGDVAEDLTDDIEEAAGQLELAAATAGLQAGGLRQAEAAVKARLRLQEGLNTLIKEETELRGRMAQTAKRQASVERLIKDLTLEEKTFLMGVAALSRLIGESKGKIAQADAEIAELEARINRARSIGTREEIASLEESLRLIRERRQEFKQTLQEQERSARGLTTDFTKQIDDQVEHVQRSIAQIQKLIQEAQADPAKTTRLPGLQAQLKRSEELLAKIVKRRDEEAARAQALLQLGGERLKLDGLNASEKKLLNEILGDQVDLESRINELLNLRRRAIATEEAARSRDRLILLEAEVEAEQKITEALKKTSASQQKIAEAEAELILLKAEGATISTRFAAEQKAIEDQMKALRKEELVDLVTLNALAGQLSALTKERAAEEARIAELIAQQQIELERQQQFEATRQEQPLVAAFAEASVRIIDIYGNMVSILSQMVSQFAGFVSDLIVDAFDPSKDVNLKERFGQFLLGLARMVINFLVQLAVVVAAMNLIPGFAAALQLVAAMNQVSSPLLGTGFDKGGLVPDKANPSPEHFDRRTQGRVKGGPPPGVSKKDKVPIWAQAREWIMRVAAVKKYGENFMADVNEGRFPLAVARAFSGVGAISSRLRRPKIGYQAGGSISSGAESNLSGILDAMSERERAPTPALVVPDEQALDRMLSVRGGAMFYRFIEQNADVVGDILRRKGGL